MLQQSNLDENIVLIRFTNFALIRLVHAVHKLCIYYITKIDSAVQGGSNRPYIKGVRDKDYLDKLKELNLWTLEERRNRADLIEIFKIYKGFTTVFFEYLFTLDCNNKGIRSHLAKLSKPRCQKDVRKYFSYRCNALDKETVSANSINVFKNRLNKIRLTRMGYFMDWL